LFAETLDDMTAGIAQVVRAGDVVVTMGAGSIGTLPGRLKMEKVTA
jgi:UDP-N-acetylmuramate--alanine ligase